MQRGSRHSSWKRCPGSSQRAWLKFRPQRQGSAFHEQRHSLEAELGAGRGMFTLAGGHSAGGRGRRGPQGLGNQARRLQLSPRVAQGHQPSHGQLSSGNKWGPTFSQEQLTCKEDEHALGQHLHSPQGHHSIRGLWGLQESPTGIQDTWGKQIRILDVKTSFSE